MNSIRRVLTALAILLLPALPAGAERHNLSNAAIDMATRLDILKRSYPDLIFSVTRNAVRLIDNRVLIADDGRDKDHRMKLASGDLEDQLSQIYPIGKCYAGRPERNVDPGRIRSEAFFKAAYGANAYQVERAARPLDWFGRKLLFSTRHGAHAALLRVRDELSLLPEKFHVFFKTSEGTFNWRPIAGTDRLSVHAFAAAIDINNDLAHYWRRPGNKVGRVRRYRNRIPGEIVEIFERHGFIWGGKWYHYDTMHFEYRPELIAIGRLAAERGCLAGPG